jgi:phospholipase/lecithinase/hemolysin
MMPCCDKASQSCPQQWKSFYYSPQSFGITASVTSTCYNSATGSVCSNPGSYLYFDTLHPVTSIHYLIAVRINQAVLQS